MWALREFAASSEGPPRVTGLMTSNFVCATCSRSSSDRTFAPRPFTLQRGEGALWQRIHCADPPPKQKWPYLRHATKAMRSPPILRARRTAPLGLLFHYPLNYHGSKAEFLYAITFTGNVGRLASRLTRPFAIERIHIRRNAFWAPDSGPSSYNHVDDALDATRHTPKCHNPSERNWFQLNPRNSWRKMDP